MKKNLPLIISSLLVLVLVVMALFAPWLAPHDPYTTDIANKLQGFSMHYPLGTDHLGRCVLSRLLYGTRTSLLLASGVLFITLIISIIVGCLAGYVGGLVDLVLMRICDVLLSIPDFIFALVIVGALGGGIKNMFVAIIFVSWVGFARIIRNMVRSLKESTYVQYARLTGVPKRKIIRRHILPFVFPQIFLLKLIGLGSTILLISELSFLGLGVTAPMAEWGMMIKDSKTYLMSEPTLMFIPGIMISLTVLIFNWFGDALRTAMDAKV